MPATISISNRLLVALAAENLDPLRPHFQPVSLPHNQTLSKPGTPIEHVYFVQQGMVSLVQPLENGAMIEVGMIGNEGFVGVPVLLGAESCPLKQWFRFPVQRYGCKQAHSGRKSPVVLPFFHCCCGMFRRSTFRSRYRRRATGGTPCRSASPGGC